MTTLNNNIGNGNNGVNGKKYEVSVDISNVNSAPEALFTLEIPAGRRAGKYLRKNAPNSFGADFTGIVESTQYTVERVIEWYDYSDALLSCHSCQSNSLAMRKLFFNTWSNIQGVSFLHMIDDTGSVVARCLINEEHKTFAPAYGVKHYLLEARLRYFEYSLGEIAPREEIIKAVSGAMSAPENGEFSETAPKSRVEYTTEVLYPLSKMEEMELKKYERNIMFWELSIQTCSTYEGYIIDQLGLYGMLDRRAGLSKDAWETCKRVDKILKDEAISAAARLQRRKRRYQKHTIRQGISDGSPITIKTKRLVPISEDWDYREEFVSNIETSLYIDFSREFVTAEVIHRKGWYKKRKAGLG